jgi:methylated-DNA-[protein]-cysteine S-methyltransferase
MITYDVVPSPVGPLLVSADDAGLSSVWFAPHDGRISAGWVRDERRTGAVSRTLAAAREELDAYFAGSLREFHVPLSPSGTPFQLRVWEALRRIPFGETVSYSTLARRIGSPDAVRAVGAANGRNPLPIIVPCHRVIGADGSLTGFGGGIERKRWLLDHEGLDLFGERGTGNEEREAHARPSTLDL